jgi:hypothetical protein
MMLPVSETPRAYVEIALKEFADWSNPKIAEVCAVDEKTVRNVREETGFGKSEPDQSEPITRRGKDGKQYPVQKMSVLTI